MKHLKKYLTFDDYKRFENVDLPKVCIVEDIKSVEYKSKNDTPFYIEALENLTVTFPASSTNMKLYYQIDNGQKAPIVGETAYNVEKGQKMYITRNETSAGSISIGKIEITNKCNVGGNLLSLHTSNYTSPAEYLHFSNYDLLSETPVVSAIALKMPANLYEFSCARMFANCTLLKIPPLELPATTLTSGCYANMFRGCTSLIMAPKLPATKLASGCYGGMFSGCTSLVTAPDLPATQLAEYCYCNYSTPSGTGTYLGMFEGCTSLIEAPELPATTLKEKCYANMFKGCTSLKKAPVLPATELISYCYREMFYGCSKLDYIKAMFTTKPSTSFTYNWVYGVAATGTFVKNAAATWDVTSVYGIPNDWTVETAEA